MTDEPNHRRLRVLVVDDDDVDRLAVRRGLARGGVDVTIDEVSAVADALSRIAATRYDCIFLDYTLPGGDGLSLLEGLRVDGLEAPVVMLTGQGDEQVAVQLMKAGAVDYLPKSAATPERLAAAVRYAVELTRARTQTRMAEEELRASVARSRFLAEASATLAGSLDVRATLDRIAALSVPILGEYCLIYLNGGDGVAAVASAHHDPAKAGFARTIARDFRPAPIHPVSGIIDVMRTGQTRVIDPISPEFLDQLSATIELRDAFRALAPTASLFVPMIARDVMGTIVFSRDASREHFTAADVSLAEDLARRAAAALDNARLFEAAEHARSRTERLQRVTAQLAAVLPRSSAGELFVQQVRDALGADTAWLSLLSEDGTELRAVADVGFAPSAIERFSRLPVDAPMPTRDILRDGHGRWFAGRAELFETFPELRSSMIDLEQEAVVLLPIHGPEGVVGIITAGFRNRREFDADEMALGTALAQQCAQALDRARLYEAEREARAEAESARTEAESANRAKSEFLARMSHDLRTPLNAIGGYAQLIEDGIYGQPTQGMLQSLARIRRAQVHLLTLINDVLSFAKLEAGQVQINIQDVSILSLLEELRSLVEPQVRDKGVRLDLQLGTADVHVRADRERVIQILVNLLTNAIKFTDAGGTLTISCASAGEQGTIAVRDTGRGIAAGQLDAIFNPFVQAGRERVDQRDGVGLGLAISRELARMMHGELRVSSTLGEGSTFTLFLPAADSASRGDQRADEPTPAHV